MKKRIVVFLILVTALLLSCKAEKHAEYEEHGITVDTNTFTFTTPEPSVTPEPPETPEATPQPTPFSVLWISDTQHVPYKRGKYPIIGQWCADQIEKRNVVQMIGTGDFVDACISRFQWDQFHQFLAPIEAKIPVFAICGNHDMRHRTLDYEPFRTGFYGEGAADNLENSYNRGQGRYAFMEAGGISWIIIGMSYHYTENEIDWMREILNENRDKAAILCFHDYLKSDGEIGSMGQIVYNTLIEPFDNVCLVLCGHHDGYVVRTDRIGDNRFVQSIMCNEQADTSRFGGVEFLEFDIGKSEIHLHSESPLRENGMVMDETIPIWIPDLNS